MAALLDTSVVVRYLTGDPARMAVRAARIIDGSAELGLTDVVIAETGYVLSSAYAAPRVAVIDALVALVQKKNLTIPGLDKGAVIQGLLLCRPSQRVSFADAMIWAAARSSGADLVYSFDERFPEQGVVVRREAP